jgi:hypothetical protein
MIIEYNKQIFYSLLILKIIKMPNKVLKEDWSDYDNRKMKYADARYFSCVETWEREYLIRKIRKNYPQYSETAIEKAIDACCKTVPSPRPRPRFVECVMARLRA